MMSWLGIGLVISRRSCVSSVRNILLLMLPTIILPLPAPHGIHRSQHPIVYKIPADIAGLARDARFVGGDSDAIKAEFRYFGTNVAAFGGRGWNVSMLRCFEWRWWLLLLGLYCC